MAQEVDWKRIELKVSLDCCDGCKKKIKKVLQSIEGVLNIKIDPSQPKLTVLGNVEPDILIKKILRAGKHAEIWHSDLESSGKGKEGVEMVDNTYNKKSKTGTEQANCPDNKAEKIKTNANAGEEIGSKAKNNYQEDTDCLFTKSNGISVTKNQKLPPPRPAVNCIVHPSTSILHDTYNARVAQYSCAGGPCKIAVPYCAIHWYNLPFLTPSYAPEYYYERPVIWEQTMQTPATGAFGDYFSDENAIGCHVM